MRANCNNCALERSCSYINPDSVNKKRKRDAYAARRAYQIETTGFCEDYRPSTRPFNPVPVKRAA